MSDIVQEARNWVNVSDEGVPRQVVLELCAEVERLRAWEALRSLYPDTVGCGAIDACLACLEPPA